MGITTFDTLKYVRRLEQVGVPSEQAEAQAEVLTEAFNVNLEELVTKDYLSASFADERAYVEKRFAEQQGYMDKRFAEQEANFKLLFWMLGVVITFTVIPYAERML
jgi:hypothetical protein